MLVIGLVGGVASGKSRVADQFAQLGAHVIRADEIGHAVLREPEVIEQLRQRWGERVIGADGQIDRAQVARIVFPATSGPSGSYVQEDGGAARGEPRSGAEEEPDSVRETPPSGVCSGSKASELRFLESVTHPRIGARIREELAALAQAGNVPAVVLDAAILLEAGWGRMCDRIVFVDAPREERLARALRRGWSASDFAAREAAQLSLKEKQKDADGVIDNSGSIDHTFAQVQQFWQSLDLSHP